MSCNYVSVVTKYGGKVYARGMANKRRNAAYVRSRLVPGDKVRMYSLGGGLILRVTKGGSGSWVQRIQVDGKRRDIALGPVEFVGLGDARKAARENKARVVLGTGELVGIVGSRAAARSTAPVFADFAREVIADRWKAGAWKRESQQRDWQASIDTWAGPIAAKPVDRIGRADVLTVMNQRVESGTLWTVRHARAKHLLQRIGSILDVAVARELIPENPADRAAITAGLPRINGAAKVQHRAAIPYSELGAFLDRLRSKYGNRPSALAVEFIALTATRSREALESRWDEFDLDAGVWAIPAARTKTHTDHCVMLSEAALAVLREAEANRDGSGLVFPGQRGAKLAGSSILNLFKGYGGTVHGLRAAFRMWAAEQCPEVPGDVAENALGHVVGNVVHQAYQRSKLDAQQRALLQAWGEYLGR